MIVTKLEQWRSERSPQPATLVGATKRQVVEVECLHCHQRFMRWSSIVSAYGRCESCSTAH